MAEQSQPFANLSQQIWRCAVGAISFGVTVVAQVLTLDQNESVRLNPDKLGDLYKQLGESGAEDVVCRAIEELAVRLSHCEHAWRADKAADLSKCARSLIAISDQIGMTALARVADDVGQAIRSGDQAAVAATVFRLMRIGEKSLTAVWDQRDLSI